MNAYVVVEFAADGFSRQVLDFPTKRAAFLFITEHYTAEELESITVDVCRQLADGSLVPLSSPVPS